MRLPGLSSLVFLAFVLVLMPVGAFRSARRLNAKPAPDGSPPAPPLPPPSQIFASTLVTLALMFLLAGMTASSFGYDLLAVPPLGAKEAVAGVVALVACLGVMLATRALRSSEERRNLPIYKLLPRTPVERALFAATALLAGVAEEAAYRGTAVQILTYALGSAWTAVLVSAVAFALAHAVQGWKAGIAVFTIALVMQWLVWFTGTLVVAMVVHTVYDFFAGFFALREARKWGAA